MKIKKPRKEGAKPGNLRCFDVLIFLEVLGVFCIISKLFHLALILIHNHGGLFSS